MKLSPKQLWGSNEPTALRFLPSITGSEHPNVIALPLVRKSFFHSLFLHSQDIRFDISQKACVPQKDEKSQTGITLPRARVLLNTKLL
ncbi:hypothetical protein TNCT_417651 [Trichonephila clavata]|uniref:Uncharacterized protein n=1 Tax=Trichonephila clavata TaxID=2740835 RepID=A0A8X6KDL3_TRICU|nr:hypothetical protein TNCT_417651 [Trichonephila clavata]